jgi:hypothetical protein
MTNFLLALASLAASVAVAIMVLRAVWRHRRLRAGGPDGELGSVSREWLMVHRAEK